MLLRRLPGLVAEPWLATVQCVLMESELQVASEAAQGRSELRGVNGDAVGDEGRITTGDLQSTPEVRITTAEGALLADKDAEGGLCTETERPKVLVPSLRGAAPGARTLLLHSFVRSGSWAVRATTRAAPPLLTCRVYLRSCP